LRVFNDHFADDLQILAILLYFGDKLADILIGNTERIHLEGRVFDEEALVE
jgi:hypothetical protein